MWKLSPVHWSSMTLHALQLISVWESKSSQETAGDLSVFLTRITVFGDSLNNEVKLLRKRINESVLLCWTVKTQWPTSAVVKHSHACGLLCMRTIHSTHTHKKREGCGKRKHCSQNTASCFSLVFPFLPVSDWETVPVISFCSLPHTDNK